MRNIFDQYSQIENRVTHALLTALDQDRSLLSSFLRDVLKVRPVMSPVTGRSMTQTTTVPPASRAAQLAELEQAVLSCS